MSVHHQENRIDEQSLALAFLTLSAEASYLFPLYSLIDRGLAAFPSSSLPNSTFPLPVWLWLIFILTSSFVNGILKKRPQRLLTLLLVNAFLGTLSIFVSMHFILASQNEGTFLDEVSLFFSASWGISNLLRIWLIALFLFVSIFRPFLIFQKSIEYKKTVSHLEISLILQFIIFFITSLNNIAIPGGEIWLLTAFASNALALSLSSANLRNGNHRLQSWLGPGFLLVILLPISVVFPFLLFKFSSPVEKTIESSLPLLNWFKEFFLKILIRLLSFGHLVPESSLSHPPETKISGQGSFVSSEGHWLNTIINYIIIIGATLIVLAITFIIVYYMYRLLKYLWLTKNPNTLQTSYEHSSQNWLKKLLNTIRYWFRKLLSLIPLTLHNKLKEVEIALAYQALLHWGDQHKRPRFRFETPYEYCTRLSQYFSKKASTLKLITDIYVLHYYGAKDKLPLSKREIYFTLRVLYSTRKEPDSLKESVITDNDIVKFNLISQNRDHK